MNNEEFKYLLRELQALAVECEIFLTQQLDNQQITVDEFEMKNERYHVIKTGLTKIRRLYDERKR